MIVCVFVQSPPLPPVGWLEADPSFVWVALSVLIQFQAAMASSIPQALGWEQFLLEHTSKTQEKDIKRNIWCYFYNRIQGVQYFIIIMFSAKYQYIFCIWWPKQKKSQIYKLIILLTWYLRTTLCGKRSLFYQLVTVISGSSMYHVNIINVMKQKFVHL